jgi:hypothetical protein
MFASGGRQKLYRTPPAYDRVFFLKVSSLLDRRLEVFLQLVDGELTDDNQSIGIIAWPRINGSPVVRVAIYFRRNEAAIKQRWTNVPFTIVSLGGVKLGLQIKRQYCSELDQEKTYSSVKHVHADSGPVPAQPLQRRTVVANFDGLHFGRTCEPNKYK